MKKLSGPDANTLYAMKVLKKASLKGILIYFMGMFKCKRSKVNINKPEHC